MNRAILLQNTLTGLNIAGQLPKNDEVTIINIICPGYISQREGAVEHFDFPLLSDQINNSPNVRLMIEKMYHYLSGLSSLSRIKCVMILADVAILNYQSLSEKQNVRKVLADFYNDINDKIVLQSNSSVEFVKMSTLTEDFKKIPIEGVKVTPEQLAFKHVEGDIRIRAEEYVGSLIFQRTNQLMSQGAYTLNHVQKLHVQAQREVARFVVEYGYAGKAIQTLYTNPVILFTEPSGYLRGYFYHAYLHQDVRMPILYTV